MEQTRKGLPKEILEVERPKGTKVKKSGNNYYVVKRTSVYVDGKRKPVETGTVGKIVDLKYIPYDEIKKTKTALSFSNCDIKTWGSIEYFDKISKDVYEDLNSVFDKDDATRIYVMALLRAVFGNIVNRDMKFKYDTSFLSEKFKGVPLSEKAICSYLDLLGRNCNTLIEFSRNKINKLDKETNIAIDGMLKDCQCTTSDFTRWSRKCKTKGSQDISIIVAYDINSGEPIAHKIYPGNMLDKTVFEDFLNTFPSDKYFCLADKGFNDTLSKEKIVSLKSNYIIPLKRNDVIAKECIKEIKHLLDVKDDNILYGTMIKDNKYYYAFRNIYDEEIEKKSYLSNASKNNKFDNENYNKKLNQFGTIVFESNKQLTPLEVYRAYEERWNIEVNFNFYKNIVMLDKVNVQDDTSIMGSEFINFISSIISCKVKKDLKNRGVSKDYSYKQVLLYLNEMKKIKNPSNNTWENCKNLKYVDELASILEINASV